MPAEVIDLRASRSVLDRLTCGNALRIRQQHPPRVIQGEYKPKGHEVPALYPLPTATAEGDQAVAIRRQVAELVRQTEALAETTRKLAAQVTELVERPVVRPQALSIDAAAESLSLSRNGVYHLLTTGQLVSVKVGTRRLIPLAAIDAFLATATATTTDEQAG